MLLHKRGSFFPHYFFGLILFVILFFAEDFAIARTTKCLFFRNGYLKPNSQGTWLHWTKVSTKRLVWISL